MEREWNVVDTVIVPQMDLTHIFVDYENVQPHDLDLLFGQHYRVKIFHGPHQTKLDVAVVKALQRLGEHVEYIQSTKSGKNALDFCIAFWIGRLLQAQESTGRPARFLVISKDGGFDSLLSHVQSLGYSARQGATIRDALIADAQISVSEEGPRSTVAQTESAKAPIDQSDLGERPATAQVGSTPVSSPVAVVTTVTERAAQAPAAKQAVPTKNTAVKEGDKPKTSATTKAELAKHVKTVIEHLRKQSKNRPAKKSTLARHFASLLGGKVAPATVQAVIAALERQGVVTFNENKVTYKLPKVAK